MTDWVFTRAKAISQCCLAPLHQILFKLSPGSSLRSTSGARCKMISGGLKLYHHKTTCPNGVISGATGELGLQPGVDSL